MNVFFYLNNFFCFRRETSVDQATTEKSNTIWAKHKNKITVIALSIIFAGLAIKLFPFFNALPSQPSFLPIQEHSDDLVQDMQSADDEISSAFQDLDSRNWEVLKNTHSVGMYEALDDHTTLHAEEGSFFLKENNMIVQESSAIACLTNYEKPEAKIAVLDPSRVQGKSTTRCCPVSDSDIQVSIREKLHSCFYPNQKNWPPTFDAKNSDKCFNNYCHEQAKPATV